MSEASHWPEGVPEIPARVYMVWVLMDLRVIDPSIQRNWRWIEAFTYDKAAAMLCDALGATSVVTLDARIVHASAAARALGIVPDGEQEPNND